MSYLEHIRLRELFQIISDGFINPFSLNLV